jgi:hypothetical protein
VPTLERFFLNLARWPPHRVLKAPLLRLNQCFMPPSQNRKVVSSAWSCITSVVASAEFTSHEQHETPTHRVRLISF